MHKKYVGIIIVSLLILVGLFIGLVSLITPVATSPNWDFECHTYGHPHLTGLTAEQIASEYTKVNSAFSAQGLPIPQHTAYPFGDYNDEVINVTKQYRKTARFAWAVTDTANTYPIKDWCQLNAVEIRSLTTWSTIQPWIDDAIARKALLNIFTHKVIDPAPLYGCTPETLTNLLNYLKQKQDAGQLKVMTMAEAYNVWSTATTNPEATVVVSFDDNEKTDYTTVWPLFKARGLAGTSYINPSAMGGMGRWAMVKEMAGIPTPTPTKTEPVVSLLVAPLWWRKQPRTLTQV